MATRMLVVKFARILGVAAIIRGKPKDFISQMDSSPTLLSDIVRSAFHR